tara:strand:+ start:41 stop:2284 length:2244 start_codon:yes stop_codon:yes gene_type:complete
MSDIRFNRWLHQSGTGGVYQASSGNVGIGTSVPSTTLDVNGSISATSVTATTGTITGNLSVGGVLSYEDVTNIDSVGVITARSDVSIADKIIHTGDTNTAIRFPAADTFTVETAGSERLRISSIGRVDIGGGSTIDSRLHVTELTASGRTNVLTLETRGTSEDDGPAINFISDSGSTVNGSIVGAKSQDSGSNAYLAFYTFNSSTLSERLRISSGGDLALGTNNPAAGSTGGYDRVFNIQAGSAGALSSISFGDSNAIGRIESVNGNNGKIIVNGSEYITFGTGGTPAERMRIMSDGTVKIGTGTGNPILMLNASTSGTSVIQMGDTADNNIGQIHYVNSDDSMRFFTNNSERLRIDSSGNVTLGFAGNSLHFQNGFNNSTARIQNGGGSNNSELKFLVRNAGTESEKMRLTSTAGLAIATAGSVLANAGNETLYIQGEGHTGHGTSNTRSVVSVIGALTSNNAGMGIWIGARTNENTAVIGTRTASGNLAVETYSGGWGERLRITSKGCLLINSTNDAGELQGSVSSTSAGNDLSSTTLDLSSGISGFNARESGNQANSGVGYWFNHGGLKAGIAVTRNVTNQWGTRMSFYTHKTTTSDIHEVYERMRINPDGEIQMYQVYSVGVSGSTRDLYISSAGHLGYSASIRAAKTNITSLSDVNWLYNLNPVSFNYREKNEETNEYLDTHHSETEYGLIAEEVESINSDLVFYDEVDGEQELRGVHYKKLVPALLKAVQDLKARLDAVEG